MNSIKHNTVLLVFILGLFSFTTSSYGQKKDAYVKFLQLPSKRLSKNHLSEVYYYVEYKTKKEATIYIELQKNGKTVANAVQTVKSRKSNTTKLNIRKFPEAKLLSGSGYSLKLFMFEGEKNNWSKRLGEVTSIRGLKLSRMY